MKKPESVNAYQKKYKEITDKIEKKERISPMIAIRMRCIDCMCWQEKEVRECPSKDCVLYRFRFGKNNTGRRKKVI